MIPARSPARRALAAFVKNRRQRFSPSGNTSTQRLRRTGGLRREELAQLAGVGITWYTWFEQGRAIRVSDAFLDNLSRALALNSGERQHLFLLAQQRLPPATNPTLETRSITSLQRIVDSHPNPAYVKDLRWDVLAWNRAASIMFGDYAPVPKDHRNALWLVFRSPAYRAFMVNWSHDACDLLARFRSDLGQLGEDERAAWLVSELENTSSEFRAWWNCHEVAGRSTGVKCFRHPDVGPIEFEHTRLRLDDAVSDPLRVVIFTPLPGASAFRAARLFCSAHPETDTPSSSTTASLAI
jgi:transcriptional regulator with XRE-family HTH domain